MEWWSFGGVFGPFVNEEGGEEGGVFLCKRAHQQGNLRFLSHGKWLSTFGIQIPWIVGESLWMSNTGNLWKKRSLLPCLCSLLLLHLWPSHLINSLSLSLNLEMLFLWRVELSEGKGLPLKQRWCQVIKHKIIASKCQNFFFSFSFLSNILNASKL